MHLTATYGTTPLETKAAPSGTSSPESWFVELLAGTATASKVRVNARSAMSVPSVKRAVDLIGGTIGMLPVAVLKVDAKGRTPATDHPAHRILARRANLFTAAGRFREQLTRDALLHGDGFAAVVRDGNGVPRELIHLPPGTVTVALDERSREPTYRVTLDGGHEVLSWHDVLHVAAPSLDGIAGASPIHLGREAIGLALTLEAHAARLFGNGARPGGVIMIPGFLPSSGSSQSARPVGDAAVSRIKASWESTFKGEGSGGTAVLEAGATFKPIALTSVDAEFMAQRRHQTREIANVFGIPSTLLGDLENATYSNVEGLAQGFRDETILPWTCAWVDALERVFLAEGEIDTHVIAFDLEHLDRADLSAKAEAMAKRRAAGTSTANEERARLNLPARPDGDVLGNPYTTANAGKPEAPANV